MLKPTPVSPQKIIVTAALPYANGDIHLGHLVEYLQVDYWVRYRKSLGENIKYFCADDTHGTPIMISARDRGIAPEALIAESSQRHQRDFAGFQIQFDHFSSTNSEVNRALCSDIFLKMKEGGHIASSLVKQAFCEHDAMFLPDRFVRGTCPKCGASDQYGDSCDKCGSTYDPKEMKSPKCSICGNTPTQKDSEHVFFKLNNFRDYLKTWVETHTATEVGNKLKEWLAEELREWDISRDEPYFGFNIPGYANKYFYVWLDAPVGYITALKEWCDKNGEDYREWWNGENSEIYHFIGKDIVYFHTLFWPAMLAAAKLKSPEQVFVHGFLTINGEKMSKSKGTFVKASTYLAHLDPEYFRYYLACKMGPGVDDLDLSLSDFVSRVNSDLIGKITNVASRGAQMLIKKLDGVIGDPDEKGREVVNVCRGARNQIKDLYLKREFGKAMIAIRDLADELNKYFDSLEPWKVAKDNPEATRPVLSSILEGFKCIAIYLYPVLPEYTARVETLFGKELSWSDVDTSLAGVKLETFTHLMKRIEAEDVEKMMAANVQ